MSEQTITIRLEEVPQCDTELMCRTITAAIHRLMTDPKNRADFEAWREKRKKHESINFNGKELEKQNQSA